MTNGLDHLSAQEYLANAQRIAADHATSADVESPRVPEVAAVIGAGWMGSGIAACLLQAGLSVLLWDRDDNACGRARATVGNILGRWQERGRITPAAAADMWRRLRIAPDLAAIEPAELVVEAVIEDMSIKQEVFRQASRNVSAATILASNTSTLDIDRLADGVDEPERVVGWHFFSPAHVMPLLEIVKGPRTTARTLAVTLEMAARMGKIPVVSKVCDGFIANRIMQPYRIEAIRLAYEGCTPWQIDEALTGFGMPMGPFTTMDLAGLEIGSRLRQSRPDLSDEERSEPVIDSLVRAGRFGQKTGGGIYRYEGDSKKPQRDPQVEALYAEIGAQRGTLRSDKPTPEEIVQRCLFAAINEASKVLQEGVARSAPEIDVALVYGYGFPRARGGLMYYADSVGAKRIMTDLSAWHEARRQRHLAPSRLLQELAASGSSFTSIRNHWE